jgi:hypothetical protein
MIDRLLRNRFLSTVAFPLAADDKGGATDAGGDTGGADDDKGAGQDDGKGSSSQGRDGGGAGKTTVLAEDVGAEDDGDADQGQDDDIFAGLTPAQKAKLEKEIAWRDRQIARLHAKKRSAEGDAEAAITIAQRATQTAKPADDKKTFTQEDVKREAQVLNAQQAYDDSCVATDVAGKKYYGDKWVSATTKLAKMGGVTVDDMVNILATDNPAVVLHSLSQDPDEYERIMGLPPARRNAAFVKLGLKEPPKVAEETREDLRPGDVARPPRTIQGSRNSGNNSHVSLYDDKVDDDAWYAARNATRRKKFSSVE